MAIAGKRSIFQDGCTLHATEAQLNVAAGLLPGSGVELDANGEFIAETSAAAASQALVLDYDMLAAGTVDDLWADNSWAIARQVTGGKLANVRVITGQAITKGIAIVSNGNGQYRVINDAAPEAETPLFYAEETITTTANNTLVRVRGA